MSQEFHKYRRISKKRLKSDLEQFKPKKSKNWAAWLIVFAIALFFVLMVGTSSDRQKSVEKPKPVIPPSPPLTTEQYLRNMALKLVRDAMGSQVNWNGGLPTLIDAHLIKQMDGPDRGGYLLQIRYRITEGWNKSSTRNGLLRNAMDFMRKLYSDPTCAEIKTCMLMPHLILVDKYGHESESQVGKLVLRRPIAQRINWENLYLDNFIQILKSDGEFWIHPALLS